MLSHGRDGPADTTHMTSDDDDDDDDHHERAGVHHVHALGQHDDLQRFRITMTTAVLAVYDDWPSPLARDLFMECLFQVTVLCKIEIAAGDTW